MSILTQNIPDPSLEYIVENSPEPRAVIISVRSNYSLSRIKEKLMYVINLKWLRDIKNKAIARIGNNKIIIYDKELPPLEMIASVGDGAIINKDKGLVGGTDERYAKEAEKVMQTYYSFKNSWIGKKFSEYLANKGLKNDLNINNFAYLNLQNLCDDGKNPAAAVLITNDGKVTLAFDKKYGWLFKNPLTRLYVMVHELYHAAKKGGREEETEKFLQGFFSYLANEVKTRYNEVIKGTTGFFSGLYYSIKDRIIDFRQKVLELYQDLNILSKFAATRADAQRGT